MTCDSVRERLTAYLDGDLDPDRGTVVRGHLRICDACRKISEQEAVLRDELRSLPTVDPPSHLWSNIQAQLAAAEVAESKRPGWKRALARWTRGEMMPRFAMGGMLAAAAVAVIWWRTHPGELPGTKLVDAPSPKIEPAMQPRVTAGCNLDSTTSTDVTADLASEAKRVTACYAQTANELLALANDSRGAWTDADRATFDSTVAELQKAVDDSPSEEGRPRQRAYRAMIRYLQNTLTRDDVALASAP